MSLKKRDPILDLYDAIVSEKQVADLRKWCVEYELRRAFPSSKAMDKIKEWSSFDLLGPIVEKDWGLEQIADRRIYSLDNSTCTKHIERNAMNEFR